MSGGGGSTNTTTTQSGPPQAFLNQYQNVNNQAQNVASVPYQPYSGNLVAPLSPDQTAGISSVENTQGIANPYINAAAQEINNSTTPAMTPGSQSLVDQATNGGVASAANAGAAGITSAASTFNPNGISQWESPYTQDVVNATENEFNNQNAQQQQGIIGNAIQSGAWGGDRSAVAQGITAGQQQLAEAPVIANLENQGYTTALGALGNEAQLQTGAATSAGQLATSGAQQQAGLNLQGAGTEIGAQEANNWLSSQAGYGLANLGNEAESTSLTGANALLGVGGLEQQQAQEGLNVPYEQYIAEQAYPFQTTSWLANIAEGLGGASGGNSSTTTPGPSVGSELLGAGAAGAGILGQTGAFGSNGYLTGANGLFGSGASSAADVTNALGDVPFDVARGGTIPHRASGGIMPPMGATSPAAGSIIPTGLPDVSVSVVPGAQGLGVPSQHGASNLLNTSTGSTTTSNTSGGGGGILGPLLDVAMIGSHFIKRGGSVPRRAFGGNVLQFPRMPHTQPQIGGGRGIVSNDNHIFAPMRKLATGGIAMPVLPTGNSGVTLLAGNGGVSIPQLTGGGGGGGIVSSSPSGIQSYLDSVAGTASHAAPPQYVPPPPPPPSAAAPPPPDPAAQFGPGFDKFGNRLIDNEGTGNRGGRVGPDGIDGRAPGGDVGGDSDLMSYSSLLGNDTGTPTLGGMTMTGLPGETAIPPNPSLGGVVPSMPDVGAGVPTGGGIVNAYQNPGSTGVTGGAEAGSASTHPFIGATTSTPAGGGAGTLAGKSSPWEALTAAGLAIMGGSSPHVLTNIGRGGMQGLQFAEQQRVRDEQTALRQLQQQSLSDYRTDLGAAHTSAAQTAAQKAEIDAQHYKDQHDLELAKLTQHQQELDQGKFTYKDVTQPDPDNPGKTISGVMKFSTSGNVDPVFIRTDTNPNKPGGAMSGREAVYLNRVTAAGNEAATAAQNIMELPVGTSTGWLGGRTQGSGIFSAVKESLTNTLTPQSVQDYNTMIAGVSRNLSTIESAGLAPSGALTHSMESVTMKEGDTPLTQMRKMAEMRQIVEKGLEPNLANPNISPAQKDMVQGIIGQIQKAIPFTQHDVTSFQRQGKPGQTFSDYAAANKIGNAGGSQQSATLPQAAAAQLQEGHVTTFANGQRWQLVNGVPQQVQ